LLFDIDRTLTDTQKVISPETIAAIKQLGELGYKIGVCSGRGVAGIKNKIFPLFPKESLHIATGGSQLVNSQGEVIWAKNIEADAVKTLKKYVLDSNLAAIFMKQDALYARGPTLSHLEQDDWNVISKDLSLMSNEGVGAIFVSNLDDSLVKFVEQNPFISFKKMVGNLGDPYIDITARGVTKATTLMHWSKETGIQPEHIIGFGDSLNDLEFLEACGFSVVMGNGVEQLKEMADRVIGHTDDNSLAMYLIKIIKGDDL